MSRANASEGWSSGEKGLPALPSVLDALAAHTQSLRMAPPWDDHAQVPTPTGSVKSRKSTKGKRRMKDLEKQMDNNRSFTPILTDIHTPPYSSRGSPATLTPARSPFTPASLDSTGSGTPHRGRFDFGGPPDSPSVASHHSMSASTKTKKSLFGTGTKGSSSAPSVRSSHTMPDMVACNDVDQWGAARAPPSPRKALDTSAAGSGVRRKNSSSKLLVNGLSRSLTRMGSVMKRSTSANDVNTSGGAGRRKDWLARRRPTQSATVAEEADMGEGWERVDMNREVTEGDTSITRPFNVEHDLHVSPDLGDLPPAWLEALKAQGLSEADLLLISAARHKAAQRPMLRVVKGSTPPPNEMPASSSSMAHAHTRGMSTPAHLVTLDHEGDKPLLNKRFSWERGTSTPTHPSASPTQLSPFREYRQSLQDPPSPPTSQTPPRIAEPDSPDHETPRQLRDTHSPIEAQQYHAEEETPRKTKRWSDQLKGFQNSFSSLGGDDDWASKLTLALGGNAGLQTVDEVDSTRGQSMDSARTFSAVADAEPEPEPKAECRPVGPIADPAAEPSTTPRSSRKNPKSLSIYAPAARHANDLASSPSPRSPGGTRIRRKPVPGQHERRYSSSRRSAGNPALDKPWPRSPPPPPRKDKPTSPSTATPAHPQPQPQSPTTVESFHISSESFGVHSSPSQRSPSEGAAQSNESEQEPDLRTPSTNRHFFHTPSSSASHRHPPMPRSISEESQFTLAFAQPRPEDVPDLPDHSLAAFSFPSKLQPRSNPRHSMPASAGYTESTPPSRGVTPSCDEREWEHEAATIPLPLPLPRTSPSTPPRMDKKSSRRNKINTPSPPSVRQAVDPLARLDTASTMVERASIALSYISNESDMRSSMASSLLHEAKVLKAYTRDLGGVEERDSASETDSSLQHRVVSASASVSGSGSNSHSEDQHSAYGHGYASSPHKSQAAPKAKTNARSSRRHVTPPRPTYPPHPFASAASRKASESGHETDDEALKALEVAAKEMAKRTGRYTSVSEERRASGCQGVFSDAED